MRLDAFTATSVTSSALTTWVGEHVEQLLTKAIMSADTMRVATVQTGCKPGSNSIVPLSTSVVLKDMSSTCAFDATSSQTLSKRVINAAILGSHIQWCNKTFLKQETAHKVRTSALGYEDIPFIEQLTDDLIRNWGVEIDKALWLGDTTAQSNNLINGFKAVIEAAGTTATSYTWDANKTLWQNVQGLILAAPAAVLKGANKTSKVRVYMAPEKLTALALDLVNANLYHYNIDNGDVVTEFVIPGTSIIATACVGLGGSTHMFIGREDNFVVGVDLEGDAQELNIWYSEDDRLVKGALESVFGVQVAFPDQIAFTTGA